MVQVQKKQIVITIPSESPESDIENLVVGITKLIACASLSELTGCKDAIARVSLNLEHFLPTETQWERLREKDSKGVGMVNG